MTDNSKPFSDMAEAIKHNEGNSFGGAFVIVPPGEGNQPLEMLMLDSRQDAAQFYGVLKSTCELQLGEIAVREQNKKAFGGRN